MLEAEAHIRGGFEDILGNCMSEAQRVQAALPIGVGGAACGAQVWCAQQRGWRRWTPFTRMGQIGWGAGLWEAGEQLVGDARVGGTPRAARPQL